MSQSFLLSIRPVQWLQLLLLMGLFMLMTGCRQDQPKANDMNKNKALIQRGFDQWAQGSGSFFDLLADDVVWTITGRSPIAKTYTSRQQFLLEAIDPLNRRLSKKIVPKLRELHADGDVVIALWEGEATAKDGIIYRNTYSWFMKIKDDKIVHVIAFFDSIELVDLWMRVAE